MSEYAKPLRVVSPRNASLFIAPADVQDADVFEKYLFEVREEILTDYSGERAAEQAVREINAFDALLAVAKAGGCVDRNWRQGLDANALDTFHDHHDLKEALEALDTQHPGWREWA